MSSYDKRKYINYVFFLNSISTILISLAHNFCSFTICISKKTNQNNPFYNLLLINDRFDSSEFH